MQDRYAGDIGDYGKLALLREIEAQGLKLGINWYRTETAGFETHEDGKYRIPERFEACAPALAAALNAIFDDRAGRSVQKLECAGLLNCRLFVDEFVPRSASERLDWHRRALKRLEKCDLVFLDPDNGLNVESVRPGSRKSVKYVWQHEIAAYVFAGKSVIFYNHRPRQKPGVYFPAYSARLASLGKPVHVMTFPRRSVRDYFIIPASPEHEKRICAAMERMATGPFGQAGFCCAQPDTVFSALI